MPVTSAMDGLARLPRTAILRSDPGFGDLGRFSILAGPPRATFSVVDDRWNLDSNWPGPVPPPESSAMQALRALFASTRVADVASLPFVGGWIGLFAYDLAPCFERLPRRHPRRGQIPDIYLGYHDTFLCFPIEADSARILATDRWEEGARAAQRRIEALEDQIHSAIQLPRCTGRLLDGPLRSDWTEDEYRAAVERTLDYIRAGDIFQANLSHRFAGRWIGEPDELARRCWKHSPAPFSALLRERDWSVVSTSPERFLLLEPDGRIETRPIKGTRPRGLGPEEDSLQSLDLFESAKDHAELAMIVDLERNDLGRVAEFGSVRVVDHGRIESFANVHHLVSTVTAQLAPGRDFVDLLGATFPGGSITGAPKIRAMEIIDELEACRRGIYTGAIGYRSDHGRADFNIAIRTVVVDEDQVGFHVGGGIVADSDPLSEYRETLAKGQRLRAALLDPI